MGSPANKAACLSGACPILACRDTTNQLKKREKKIIINFVVGKLVRIDISEPFNRAKLPVQ